MKKRVLVVVGTMSVGGNERFVLNLIKNLDKNVFVIDLLIYSDINLCKEWFDIAKQNCNSVYLNMQDNHSFVKDIAFAKRILNSNEYDVIHCNSCSLSGLLRTVIANKHSVNTTIIAHSHNAGTKSKNIFSNIAKDMMRIYLSNSIDYGFACSDVAAKSKFTQKLLESPKYYFINNAIDTEMYKFNNEYRNEIRTELNIDEDTLLIGNIGRLDYQKNQIYLLEILKKIIDQNLNIKLLIIGDGNEKENLLNKAKEYNILDDLIILSSRDDINKYYSAMDCFVMTSRFEGFPFVLVEAQINGLKCIISTNISKNVDIVGQIDFIDLDNVDEWVNAIKQVNGRISKRDVDFISEKFEIKKEIEKIEDVYRKA